MNKIQESIITTKEQFAQFSKKFQETHAVPYAYALGSYYVDLQGNTIATKWLTVNVNTNKGTIAAIMDYLQITLEDSQVYYREISQNEISELFMNYFSPFNNDGEIHQNLEVMKVTPKVCFIAYPHESILQDFPIQNIADAHFRLAAISRRIYQPNSICLDKLFTVLPNLVWTINDHVMTVSEWNNTWMLGQLENYQQVVVDKIPLLTWGAPIPEGVRIPNPYSARLGAYLSPGTTIMHYGFVNANAGTLGGAMIEGTIAYGVTVGDGAIIGKGGGFLGTLSGGNTVKISTGSNCLIGALAECGIPLGDNCVVAAGVVFTANTPVLKISKHSGAFVYKAKDFANISNLTFRRNAITGSLEVIEKENTVELNKDLHKNVAPSAQFKK